MCPHSSLLDFTFILTFRPKWSGWFQTTLDVVHSQMSSLLKLLVPTSKMSPGYVDRPDNGDVATIDTRYAVGIDVVRFQK